MALPISIIKRGADGKAYSNISGVWRQISDTQNIPGWASIPVTDEAEFGRIYRGTSGGEMSYNQAITRVREEQERSYFQSGRGTDPTGAYHPPTQEELTAYQNNQPRPYATWQGARLPVADSNAFRPRAEGEDMTSYLQAKQAHEIQTTGKSTIDFGTPPTTGTQAPSTAGTQPPAPPTGTEVPEDIARSKSGEYYKVGNDVHRSSDNQKIDLAEFKSKGLNFELLPEGRYYKVGNEVFGPQGKIDQAEFQRLGLNFALLPEGKTAGAPGTEGDMNAPVAGKKFQESEQYKALSASEKELVDLAFSGLLVGGQQEADRISEAIKTASAIVDPYSKAKFALFNAELTTALAKTAFDFQTQSDAVTRARDQLLQDIATNKENLTVEQQSEMARQARSFDEDLLTIADQAAEKGITFATGARSRALAETRRTTQYEDVVQSSQRLQNIKMKELELRAARGEEEATIELNKLKEGQSFQLQNIGLQAEKVLGTAGLPAVAGYTPVGGVTGDIEQERRLKMIDLAGGLKDIAGGITPTTQ